MLVSDYGPTIILEHKVENQIYTIRPPIDSLEDLTLGAVYKKGQQIATLERFSS
jgi:hypothetical protein